MDFTAVFSVASGVSVDGNYYRYVLLSRQMLFIMSVPP